jgi:hypothetical protein
MNKKTVTPFDSPRVWRFLLLFCIVFGAAVPPALAETRFSIISSVTGTWVARGLSGYTITEADGWAFTPRVGRQGRDNYVEIGLGGPALPAAPSVSSWSVGFAAPGDAVLTVGTYENATRFPFQAANVPAMDFSSTGRGDNRLLADFEVLEISFEPNGDLRSLAVDFTYYGEERLHQPTVGEIRFNAGVPEPTAGALALVAFCFATKWRRRRAPLASCQ